ncbi:MAG: DinB family protein [Candidatus Korobacteraceae bacterium]
MNQTSNQPEPWLRGTLTETPAVPRAVLHALQAAEEDLLLHCRTLTDDQIHQRPSGVASVAFHLRHIPGSIDRLLTYAEGRELSDEQLQALKAEGSADITVSEALRQLSEGLRACAERIRRFDPADLEQARYVGRRRMPTTVGGLLVHIADHTQRHVGQAITTARIVSANK